MSSAQDMMNKKLITVDLTASVAEVEKIMDKNNVSSILVLTKNEKLQTTVTGQVMISFAAGSRGFLFFIRTLDKKSLSVTIPSPLTQVYEIAQKILDKKIRRVVAVDHEQPLGIITVTDFVKHIRIILSDSEINKSKLYEMFEDYEDWIN